MPEHPDPEKFYEASIKAHAELVKRHHREYVRLHSKYYKELIKKSEAELKQCLKSKY